jgi:hypothetical protein
VLVVVLVEVVPAGLAVVANVLLVAAHREAVKVALRELGPVLGRVGRVVAGVFFGSGGIAGIVQRRGFSVLLLLFAKIDKLMDVD